MCTYIYIFEWDARLVLCSAPRRGITAGLCGHPNQFSRWTIHCLAASCVCMCLLLIVRFLDTSSSHWIDLILSCICPFVYSRFSRLRSFIIFFYFFFFLLLLLLLHHHHHHHHPTLLYFVSCCFDCTMSVVFFLFFFILFCFLSRRRIQFLYNPRVYYAASYTCNSHVPFSSLLPFRI